MFIEREYKIEYSYSLMFFFGIIRHVCIGNKRITIVFVAVKKFLRKAQKKKWKYSYNEKKKRFFGHFHMAKIWYYFLLNNVFFFQHIQNQMYAAKKWTFLYSDFYR